MKFLPDQDVYALTARFLAEQGHDVVTASQLDLSRAQDSDLLKRAADEGRIFVGTTATWSLCMAQEAA